VVRTIEIEHEAKENHSLRNIKLGFYCVFKYLMPLARSNTVFRKERVRCMKSDSEVSRPAKYEMGKELITSSLSSFLHVYHVCHDVPF
jgi:hypothetical protein